MRRLLNPEIALGFLTATLLWIGLLGWQASYAPTDGEKRQCEEAATKSGHKTEECKTIWERTTTDPVAFFTFWLVVFTGGLGVSTVMLWLAGEKQFRHAETTAQRQLRAYVLASRGRVRNFGTEQPFEARVMVKNSGQSPASNVVAWIGIKIGKFPDPGDLGGPPADLHVSKGVIGPNATVTFKAIVERPYTVSQLERIRSGAATVYIFGEIKYLDIFNREQSSTYRYTYGGPGGENKKGSASNAASGNKTS